MLLHQHAWHPMSLAAALLPLFVCNAPLANISLNDKGRMLVDECAVISLVFVCVHKLTIAHPSPTVFEVLSKLYSIMTTSPFLKPCHPVLRPT